MRFWLTLCLLSSSLYAFANHPSAIEEARYNSFMSMIQQGHLKTFFALDQAGQKILVDALWDAQEEHSQDVSPFLAHMQTENFTILEQLRLSVIAYRAGKRDDLSVLSTELLTQIPQNRDLAILVVSLRYDLYQMGLNHIVETATQLFPEETRWVAASERPVGDQKDLAVDLWNFEPDLSRHQQGTLGGGIRIYMFCRTIRLHACIMAVRDQYNRPVLDQDGKLWTQPALASASRGLPSYQRNGNTPAGIHEIQGVMPAADQQISFGKFRRLILEFVKKTNNESAHLALLPESSRASAWWRPATIARDVGRSLLRVHGTGRMNSDPTSSWFPFMRTSGCIAKRENTYNGITYQDQRELLDVLMEAQGLQVSYANEAKIKGLLYLIEIDDKDAPVTAKDLAEMGIE